LTNFRGSTLNSILGRPWKANAHGPDAFDCWHLVMFVQRALFDRNLPDVDVPDRPTWPWMIKTIAGHDENANWRLVPVDPMGLVQAKDGAIVLMARSNRPAHVGTWLEQERRIIHADPNYGVVTDGLLDLRTKGWVKLRFYEHV